MKKGAYILAMVVLVSTAFICWRLQQAWAQRMQEHEVTANEDLMREHGLINRILLIYERISSMVQNDEPVPFALLEQSASLVRDFVENYHERLEEQYVFPRLEKVRKLSTLTCELRRQHDAGRTITQAILIICGLPELNSIQKNHLITLISLFVRMYRAHEAREDTVVFPTFANLLSEQEYEQLGALFEYIEEQHFGEHGFERVLAKVEALEKQLGIYDLSQFTPQLPTSNQ